MYLTQSLRRAMQQTPHATASIYNGRKRSFAQLGERVARFAGALQALGAQAGDRWEFSSLNSDWYLEYYLATTGQALPSTPSISDGVLRDRLFTGRLRHPFCWWMTAFAVDS
jgi:long-subunit acyl-CoA synthetase (AMP-forming)